MLSVVLLLVVGTRGVLAGAPLRSILIFKSQAVVQDERDFYRALAGPLLAPLLEAFQEATPPGTPIAVDLPGRRLRQYRMTSWLMLLPNHPIQSGAGWRLCVLPAVTEDEEVMAVSGELVLVRRR